MQIILDLDWDLKTQVVSWQ